MDRIKLMTSLTKSLENPEIETIIKDNPKVGDLIMIWGHIMLVLDINKSNIIKIKVVINRNYGKRSIGRVIEYDLNDLYYKDMKWNVITKESVQKYLDSVSSNFQKVFTVGQELANEAALNQASINISNSIANNVDS